MRGPLFADLVFDCPACGRMVRTYDSSMVKKRPCIDSNGWCPLCYEGRKGRAVHRGHFSGGLRICMKGGASLPLPQPKSTATAESTSSSGPLTLGWLLPLPELSAFLTSVTFPDGSKRQPGRLSFSYASGVITLSLMDPSSNHFVSRSSRSMDDLLLGLEEGLASSSLDWMPSKYPAKGRR